MEGTGIRIGETLKPYRDGVRVDAGCIRDRSCPSTVVASNENMLIIFNCNKNIDSSELIQTI